MPPRGIVRMFPVFCALTLAALVAFAACGDDEEGIDVSGVPELQDGVLNVGSEIAYAPFEFFQEGTEIPDGVDIDLAKALAGELGVEVQFVNTGFEGIILSLQTDEFDVIMSAMTIRPDREEEIDFVPYLSVGTGILVPAGNPNNIQGLEDLCGLTVAVQIATIQLDMANEQSAKCDQKINVVPFDTNPLAVEDLRTGGADANLADFPTALLDAEESAGALEVLDAQLQPEPYGIGVRKESTAQKAALEEALQAIQDSGKYDEILTKWDVASFALP